MAKNDGTGARQQDSFEFGSITSSERTFARSVDDLIRRLTPDPSNEAQALLREALELDGSFRAWQTERPSNEDRVLVIRRLFDLNRRAMEYLSGGRAVVSTKAPSQSGEHIAVGSLVGKLIRKYASRSGR